MRCCGKTLNRPFMLKNRPMWLNFTNSAKKNRDKFLHEKEKVGSPAVRSIWLQLWQPKVAKPLIQFRGSQLISRMGEALDFFFFFFWFNHAGFVYFIILENPTQLSVTNMQKQMKSGKGQILFKALCMFPPSAQHSPHQT